MRLSRTTIKQLSRATDTIS